ncbi:MAG: ferredoxin [Nocardioides sp.]
MKIKVDFDLCESNGVCEAMAPDIFELDDNNWLVVKTDEVTEENRSAVNRAVQGCPRAAITLAED